MSDSPGVLDVSRLRLVVADRITPFFDHILKQRRELIIALHVIGSAVTDDFDPDRSDVNSMIVLREMDLDFLDLLAPLCRDHANDRIAPPVLMTPNCIARWREDSPVELLDVKLVNALVYGADLFSSIEIDRALLRIQCKRELHNRLIMLSWGYVEAAGNKRALTDLLVRSVYGLAPLLRAVFAVRGDAAPLTIAPLFDALASLVHPSAVLSFKEVYWMKQRGADMPVARVRATLKDYYRAIEALTDVVDRTQVPGP